MNITSKTIKVGKWVSQNKYQEKTIYVVPVTNEQRELAYEQAKTIVSRGKYSQGNRTDEQAVFNFFQGLIGEIAFYNLLKEKGLATQKHWDDIFELHDYADSYDFDLNDYYIDVKTITGVQSVLTEGGLAHTNNKLRVKQSTINYRKQLERGIDYYVAAKIVGDIQSMDDLFDIDLTVEICGYDPARGLENSSNKNYGSRWHSYNYIPQIDDLFDEIYE